MMPPRFPAVYRYYDADDRLLYIGSSLNFLGRFAQLGEYFDMTQVVRITVAHYPTIAEARQREGEAIFADQPPWNKRGKTVLYIDRQTGDDGLVPRNRAIRGHAIINDYWGSGKDGCACGAKPDKGADVRAWHRDVHKPAVRGMLAFEEAVDTADHALCWIGGLA